MLTRPRQLLFRGGTTYLRNPEYRELFLSGLRLAMGEAI
jgi:hypothetical protein